MTVAAVLCFGLPWATRDCFGLLWALFGYSGLLRWLLCSGYFGLSKLPWAALGSAGLLQAALGCLDVPMVVYDDDEIIGMCLPSLAESF